MIQQGDKSADKHVQEFEKAALEAGYEGYPLVVEFKHLLEQHQNQQAQWHTQQ